MSKRILIADDAAVVRASLRTFLSDNHNYAINTASNGKQALKMCLELFFDLLITDVEMPEMTGAEIVPLIKERKPELKILMMSGGEMTEDRALDLGADAFVSKSAGTNKLLEKVHDLIGQ